MFNLVLVHIKPPYMHIIKIIYMHIYCTGVLTVVFWSANVINGNKKIDTMKHA